MGLKLFRHVFVTDSQGYKVSSCGQRRFRSDCAYAQAIGSSLAHMSEGTFWGSFVKMGKYIYFFFGVGANYVGP